MLSATKRIASSTLSSGNFIGMARGRVLKGFIRSYIPGRNWKVAGGISLHNGIAEVPETCGSVYSSRKTKCGVIVLNRPKYSNAMNRKSYNDILKSALNYESNEHLGSVIMVSSNPKVFCMGLDYKSCFFESNGNNMDTCILAAKRREYDLLNQISISDIPFVTIMDGKACGDGVALGLAGRFPIVTENTSISFPEVRYGYFPDGASSKMLCSLGGLGMYLALTGNSISGLDLIHYGIFQHYIERSSITSLVNDLSLNHSRDSNRLQTIIETTTTPLPNPPEELIDRYNTISQLFNPCFHSDSSVMDLIRRLQGDSSEFAKQTLQRLIQSPSMGTLQLVWRSVIDAGKLSIHGTLKRDYQVCYNLLHSDQKKDYLNGIRSRFIDRKRDHSEVVISEEAIEAANRLFIPSPEAELALEKTNLYDIPLFHGDAVNTESEFNEVNQTKYDWKRIKKELLHMEEEEPVKDGLTAERRSFVHPVTGLTHPVPLEWEEDIRFAKTQQRLSKQAQMETERDVVLSSVPRTKYEQ